MLDVRENRLDYGDMLIPPDGYQLAKAVAATFSLDLTTLLSIPVALFFSQTMEGDFERERVQILEAIKRCPDVLRVYHQTGRIIVPEKHNRLYGLLESCVVGILPDSAFTSFHPKVWVLRYEPRQDSGADQKNLPITYRVIVLSRNLTTDRSWDLAVHLDGKLTNTRVDNNQPLVDFINELRRHEDFPQAEQFVSDLGRVQFLPPNRFRDDFRFHPIGIPGYENPIVHQRGQAAFCISPFVSETALQRLLENVTDDVFFLSRREELQKLRPEVLQKLPQEDRERLRLFAISDLIVDGEKAAQTEDGEGIPREQNLHAKLFVYQQLGLETMTWYLGSANATQAAFERNVEFLVELQGRTPDLRLETLQRELLGADEKAGMFEPYSLEAAPVISAAEASLEQELRKLEYKLLSTGVVRLAEVLPSANNKNFDLHLELHLEQEWDSRFRITLVPFNADSVPPQEFPAGGGKVVFSNINETNLSQFLRFDISNGSDHRRSFLLKITITGMPESRSSRIIRSIIDSRDRFFEYLQFLLQDDDQKDEVGTTAAEDASPSFLNASIWEISGPVFERLLVCASRTPKRLRAIDDVIEQLCRGDEADPERKVIPEEFLQFWNAFKEIVASEDAGASA